MNLLTLESPRIDEMPPRCEWRPLIEPLLDALHIKVSAQHLRAAMSAHPEVLDGDRFRNIMTHLGYSSRKREDYPQALNHELLPAICVDAKSTPRLLVYPQDIAQLPAAPMTLLLFEPIVARAPSEATMAGLRKLIRRFKGVLRQVILISLLISVATLAPAYFNMAIYDRVISPGTSKGLFMLSVGALAAIAAEFGLRQLRSRRLAWFGARIDHFVSCSVFERLMYLPPHYTERAKVSSQLARLRDFEAVREFFTGPLATLFFELPLIAVYLIAMAAIGGWLAAVPVVLLFAFIILLFIADSTLKFLSQTAATAVTRRQEFLLETVVRLRAIRLAGLEDVWQQRCRHLSSVAAYANFRMAFGVQILEIGAYMLMTIGVAATVVFGVHSVIIGSLSTGGLIATIILMWRIVTPMQIYFSSINRLRQLSASTKQIQHLLSVPAERPSFAPVTPIPGMKGQISFNRVWLRYSPEAEPALHGVSLMTKPGEIIAIRGSNGSGKSTLLKVLLGMYPIQSGSIRIDGVDIRQLDPISLRQAIGYVPQTVVFFPGSVRDNLLLSNPAADEQSCIQALSNTCALDEVMALPKGLDALIAGEGARPISYLLRHRLNLARAYVKPARIILFDEGSYSLGSENDAAFAQKIKALRGRSTVLLVTHREDHMQLADTLLVIEKGEVTHIGPPDQVVRTLRTKRM